MTDMSRARVRTLLPNPLVIVASRTSFVAIAGAPI